MGSSCISRVITLLRDELLGMLKADGSKGVVVDVKGIRTRKEFEEAGCKYWRL